MDIPAILNAVRPEALWTLNGDDYSGLTWLDDSPKPTKKTLEDAWPQVQHNAELERIKAQRNIRYQSETDPLFFKAQRGEDGVTMSDWQAAVDAIRADLPYPTAPEA